MELHGLNALVTGASQGLGRALAFELARHGARVALVARGAEALDSTVAEIRAVGGVAHAIAGDIGDKSAIHRIAGAAAGCKPSIRETSFHRMLQWYRWTFRPRASSASHCGCCSDRCS